jgi:hypothetical protein
VSLKLKLSLTDERGTEIRVAEEIAYTGLVDLTPGHPCREMIERYLPHLMDRLAVASCQPSQSNQRRSDIAGAMQADADKIVSEGNYGRGPEG